MHYTNQIIEKHARNTCILCHKEIEWMRFGDRDNEKASGRERGRDAGNSMESTWIDSTNTVNGWVKVFPKIYIYTLWRHLDHDDIGRHGASGAVKTCNRISVLRDNYSNFNYPKFTLLICRFISMLFPGRMRTIFFGFSHSLAHVHTKG